MKWNVWYVLLLGSSSFSVLAMDDTAGTLTRSTSVRNWEKILEEEVEEEIPLPQSMSRKTTPDPDELPPYEAPGENSKKRLVEVGELVEYLFPPNPLIKQINFNVKLIKKVLSEMPVDFYNSRLPQDIVKEVAKNQKLDDKQKRPLMIHREKVSNLIMEYQDSKKSHSNNLLNNSEWEEERKQLQESLASYKQEIEKQASQRDLLTHQVEKLKTDLKRVESESGMQDLEKQISLQYKQSIITRYRVIVGVLGTTGLVILAWALYCTIHHQMTKKTQSADEVTR